MAAVIRIGGKVKKSLLPELCRVLRRDGASLDWGDKSFAPNTEQEILEARVEHGGALVLQLVDDSAVWGQFQRLEDFLRTNCICFNRHTDCEAGYDGELIQSRKRKRTVSKTDASGDQVVPAFALTVINTKLATALMHLEADNHEDGLKLVRQAKALLQKSLPPDMGKLETLEFV